MNKFPLLILLVIFPILIYGQTFGVKTNTFYWATTTPNLGIEVSLSKKTSFDLTVGYNPWIFKGEKKLKHVGVMPEFRYWTCEKFNGHFIGVHGHYAFYNAGGVKFPLGIAKPLRYYRFQGHLYGGGFTYGYQWMIGKRWNLEASVGVGYTRFSCDKYVCYNCGTWEGKAKKDYVGPTKATLSIIYIIK